MIDLSAAGGAVRDDPGPVPDEIGGITRRLHLRLSEGYALGFREGQEEGRRAARAEFARALGETAEAALKVFMAEIEVRARLYRDFIR